MKTYKLTKALRKLLKQVGFVAPKDAVKVRIGGLSICKRFKPIV